MNGCRTLYNKDNFNKIEDLGWGYSIRVGCYEMTLDSSVFVSAFEIIKKNYPTDEEIQQMENEALSKLKSEKIFMINSLASSSEVKHFIKSNKNIWWNSETRSSIRSSLTARSSNWYLDFDGEIVNYSTKKEATTILDKIELYASECHKAVCTMINDINSLSTIDEIRNYSIVFPSVVNLDI